MTALFSSSRREKRAFWAPLIAALLLLWGNQFALAADESEKALREELAKRDAVIADLLKRVQDLERRADAAATGGRSQASASPQPPARVSSSRVQAAEQPAPRPRSRPMSQASTSTAPERSSAPGAVDVDELAAERALERTLTAEGALLLPAKRFEVQPFFGYTRRESDAPTLVAVESGVLARTLDVKRDEFDFGIRGRYGLPYDMQLEFDLPYRAVDQTTVRPVGLTGFDKSSDSASSVGDISVGIAKTLMRERGWLPDLVGRLTWDTDTGDSFDNGISLGGIGFHEVRASLSALKRQDPLAFTATLSYETAFEKDGLEPGDEFGISLGASLAASPETALSVALAQSFAQEFKVDGRNVSGSNQVSSVLLLGASSVLARNALLFLTVGIGLTDDAPDYAVNLSLPIRF